MEEKLFTPLARTVRVFDPEVSTIGSVYLKCFPSIRQILLPSVSIHAKKGLFFLKV